MGCRSTGDGQNYRNIRQYRNKQFVVAALKEHLYHYSCVCLCCVVPVSVHYRLCLVTVCMTTAKWEETCQLFKEGI